MKERVRELRRERNPEIAEESVEEQPLFSAADAVGLLGEEEDEQEKLLVVPDGFKILPNPRRLRL